MNVSRQRGQISAEIILGLVVLMGVFIAAARVMTAAHIHMGTHSLWQDLIIRYHNASPADISDAPVRTEADARHHAFKRIIEENDGFQISTAPVGVIDQAPADPRRPAAFKEVFRDIPNFEQRIALY